VPCYYPVKGYRSKITSSNGKRPIVFTPSQGFADMEIVIPCGRCIGCRLDISRQWAIRCMHEAACHARNSFITLTLADSEKLPLGKKWDPRPNRPSGSTYLISDLEPVKVHFRNFMKRLRYYHGDKIRFYGSGEYGELGPAHHPHIHVCLFGIDFPDKVHHSFNKETGIEYFKSERLAQIWEKGFNTVGDLNFQTAGYAARYQMKKQNGENEFDHYCVRDDFNGHIVEVSPEFSRMSRNPGIGHNWFMRYHPDLRKGYITINGKKVGLPKYYEKLLYELQKGEHTDALRQGTEKTGPATREVRAAKKKAHKIAKEKGELFIGRLEQKEKVKKQQLKSLTRRMSDD
jgi:hypothetical protein